MANKDKNLSVTNTLFVIAANLKKREKKEPPLGKGWFLLGYGYVAVLT